MFANVVDIRKINTNGKQSRKLLEEPKGTIIAVDYDPVQKRVKDHTNTITHMAVRVYGLVRLKRLLLL